MTWIGYLWAATLGLVTGSFLNVVIHRLPRARSFVLPRSRCPWCGGAIRPLDNLPVVSFLWLRGRCRACRAPISLRYPLIEALTAGLFVACLARFGPTPEAAISAVLCCLLVVLAAIDVDFLVLPDAITLPGILLGLAAQPLLPRTTFADAAIGTLAGAGVMILLINFWYWWRGEEGMGMGDVNMLALVGAFLGWRGVAVTLFAGAVAGALTGLALILRGRLRLGSKLPFGAFLALGGLVALFVGETLVDAYLGLSYLGTP